MVRGIFTILLKGYSQEGKMNAARALLDEMIAQGVAPDARAVNAFFRGARQVSRRVLPHSLSFFPCARLLIPW